ncbi:MAG: hypothetical protein QM817_30715 [Archangium sp.]
MSSASDQDHVRALEGGAALLEASRLRLEALVPALESWRWRTRVREVADIARAVIRSLPELRPLVERARRRATSENWAKASAVRTLVERVAKLLSSLDEAVTSREYESLEQLVVSTIGLTRKVAIHERETAASEVLDAEDPLVARLARFHEEVSKVFGRPRQARTVSFTFEDHERLRPVWRDGENALAEAWARIARVDSTGGVERWLKSRAAVAPRQSGRAKTKSGPAVLAAAEFWRTHALALRTQFVTEHFAPVRVQEEEESEALKFLLQRHTEGAAVLGEDARAALLMLAHELMGGAPGRIPLTGGVHRVRAWAELADTLPRDDEDWVRLRDSLRVVMARTVSPVLPPLKRVPGTPPRRSEQLLADFFPLAAGS